MQATVLKDINEVKTPWTLFAQRTVNTLRMHTLPHERLSGLLFTAHWLYGNV